MVTRTEDLKTGGEGNASGADQPGKGTSGPSGGGEEATGATGASGPSGATGPAEETVSISKSELERLKKDAGEKDNYRRGIIRLNRSKGRFLPGSGPEEGKPSGAEATGATGAEEEDLFGGGGKKPKPKGDTVSKQDLQIRDEKTAIAIACENPEVEDNWDDIVVYYDGKRGKGSVGEILADIRAAHKEWQKRNKPESPKPDSGKKTTQELATDKGTGKGKEKQPIPPKKHIIPRREKMENWYK